MKAETLARLNADRATKRGVVLATDLASGEAALLYPPDFASPFGPQAAAAAREAWRSERSGKPEGLDRPLFLNVFAPPARMIVVGAVHISQALAPMAAMAGYDVVIIDPRRAFASEARFPGVMLDFSYPDEAMARLAPDRGTAVITLTHDPKIDDPALIAALGSEAFYIGALGSKKTHAARLARLAKAGFDAAAQARIHGPVGLRIGAKSPAEIAISILAEVTAHRRGAAEPAEG
ncbi:MAG: xanthine dehydrogenase [Alphaproteobacteria bacterium]|nr:xanthine dehydrogenase [Alphaproteobacteria bacterium]